MDKMVDTLTEHGYYPGTLFWFTRKSTEITTHMMCVCGVKEVHREMNKGINNFKSKKDADKSMQKLMHVLLTIGYQFQGISGGVKGKLRFSFVIPQCCPTCSSMAEAEC